VFGEPPTGDPKTFIRYADIKRNPHSPVIAVIRRMRGSGLNSWQRVQPLRTLLPPEGWRARREPTRSPSHPQRLDNAGEIIDNNFISAAPRAEVTIRPSDYAFNSEDCGRWVRIG